VKAKDNKPLFLFQGSLINSLKQGGAAAIGEGCDIVTGETCFSDSLNANSLGYAAVLLFPVFSLCGRAVRISPYR
jgi:hypothetical protein